ncbi:MAG: Hemerythrin cation binding domain protein [Frankiales bacterium]|nr:Hemerythrin cation binding domain protein [Frankiales bacterium]
MDVINLIMSDHRALEKVFDKIEKVEKDEVPERIQLLQQVRALLVPHSKAEEEIVYPAIVQVVPSIAENVEEGVAEHHHVEDLFTQVLADPTDPGVDAMIAGFIAEIKHHVEEEESEILPQFRKASDAATLHQLAVKFAAGKAQHLKALGLAPEEFIAPSLIDLSKDQLVARAKAIDLDAPTGLTKDELVTQLLSS